MVFSRSSVIFALCLVATSNAVVDKMQSISQEETGMNPIRKVVSLLQKMAEKVQKEGEKEKELFEKFDCYCKTEGGNLQLSISESTAKVPSIQSDIEESTATLAQLKQDLVDHTASRSAAKEAIADATAVREKENAAYVEEAKELKGYVTGLETAVKAIQSGMSGTALLSEESTMAAVRRAVMASTEATDDDQQGVLAFLSGKSSSETGYVPRSGEIVGILSEMLDGFKKDLAAVEEKEAEAVTTFDELVASKTKEIESLSDSIEKKTVRVGELQMAIVRMQAEMSDTEAALVADQKFLKELDGNCDSKKGEFEERVKIRADELVAIQETIKILNDDDALELFKKTLPGAAFLQVKTGTEQTNQQKLLKLVRRTRSLVNSIGGKLDLNSNIRFLELALMGKKVDFSKIVKMIDNMVGLLKQEQADDDAKQEYCVKQIDQAEDKAKELTHSVSDLEADIDEHTAAIQQLGEEVKALQAGISELDKSVQEATEQRKKENEEYTELMSGNTAAKELLEFAKNRLNKFYNPRLYKAPPKRELNEEEKIYTNFGGELEPTPAPGGIAGTGVEVFLQERMHRDEPAPPPATWGEYQKQSDTPGVVKMIDLLVRDLDKEMTAAETEEKMSQKSYEELMDESASKRAKDLKLIGVKESTTADLEGMLTSATGELDATKKELAATSMYESQLHSECDWLMQNYDLRKSARAEESDNLKAAKAVLAGADFSLLQDRNTRFLSRHQ